MSTSITQIPSHKKGQGTCHYHKGRQLELYCEQCQEVACLKCLSSVHKRHTVCELSDVNQQKKQDIVQFIDLIEKYELIELEAYIADTDTLLQDNDSAFEELSSQLKRQTESLKEELDNITAETISLYQKMKDDNANFIQKYKQDLEIYNHQLKQLLQGLKKTLQRGSLIEIYDTECKLDSEVNLPDRPVLSSFCFNPNRSPRHYLELALGDSKILVQVQTADRGRTEDFNNPGQVQTSTDHGRTEDFNNPGQVQTSTDHGRTEDFDNLGQVQTPTDQDRPVALLEDQKMFSAQHQRSTDKKKSVIRNTLRSETKLVQKWKSPSSITSICPTIDDQAWTSACFSRNMTLLDRTGTAIQEVTHEVKIIDSSLSPVQQRDYGRVMKATMSWNYYLDAYGTDFEPRKHSNVSVLPLVTISLLACQNTSPNSPQKVIWYSLQWLQELKKTHYCAHRTGSQSVRSPTMSRWPIIIKVTVVTNGNVSSSWIRISRNSSYTEAIFHVYIDSWSGNIVISEGKNNRVLVVSGEGEFLRILHKDSAYIRSVGLGRAGILWVVVSGVSILNQNVKLLKYSR